MMCSYAAHVVTMPWKVDPNGDLVEDEEFEDAEKE